MSDTPQNDKSKQQIRHLRELIAALDRRVPRIERVGEADIARDAAALKKKALERLAELQADVEGSRRRYFLGCSSHALTASRCARAG